VKSGLSIKTEAILDVANMTEDTWKDIVKYNTTMHEMEQEEIKRKREENKLKVKEELAKQVEEKKL
jgi:hypothetical protein